MNIDRLKFIIEGLSPILASRIIYNITKNKPKADLASMLTEDIIDAINILLGK